jgi:branched-chain amino acid transport system permease protein
MAPPRSFMAREAWPLALFVALAAVPFLSAADPFILSLVSRGMILGLAALALDLVLGYGALVSFGHAAFIGIGAYAVAIAASHGVEEFFIAVPIAVAAGVAFAVITGAISLKTRGVYFIMITLAFAQMAYFTTQSLTAYGGDDGLSMAHRSLVFGTRVLEIDAVFYGLVLAILGAVYLVCRRLVASRFGRALRATRENERRAAALGFDVFQIRLVAYAISGAIAALAGVLFANLTEFVAPAYLSWQRSGELIVMVVLGGMGTLHGAVLGAIAVVLTEEGLSHLTQHWKAIFGPLIILLALFAKGGLVRLLGGRR